MLPDKLAARVETNDHFSDMVFRWDKDCFLVVGVLYRGSACFSIITWFSEDGYVKAVSDQSSKSIINWI